MSAGEVNTSLTGEETCSLDRRDVEDVSSDVSTSEKVARQIRVVTDALTKQLEKLCDLMVELRWEISSRNEGTSASVQGPSEPRGERYDSM